MYSPKLWNIQNFIFFYLMVFINIDIFPFYKFVWTHSKDKFRDPEKKNKDCQVDVK